MALWVSRVTIDVLEYDIFFLKSEDKIQFIDTFCKTKLYNLETKIEHLKL